MNEPGNPPIESADRTIRNQRYHLWPPIAILLGAIGAMAAGAWQLEPYTIARVIYVAVCVIVVFCLPILALRMPLLGPVWRLKLGESLQVFGVEPGIWPLERIERIDFGPDPAEDYVEGKLPVPMVQVTLAMRYRVRRRLIVSAPGAARLREWAASKGIAVNDPGGHSLPRSRE
ncbi:MAG TPA: hypothetical protein VKE40_06840 [Gemmataceae bacterium]|nr:hypothetical protein [Gemmataceae bacterium]